MVVKLGFSFLLISFIFLVITLIFRGENLDNQRRKYIFPGIYCIYSSEKKDETFESHFPCGDTYFFDGENGRYYYGKEYHLVLSPVLLDSIDENSHIVTNFATKILSIGFFIFGFLFLCFGLW